MKLRTHSKLLAMLFVAAITVSCQKSFSDDAPVLEQTTAHNLLSSYKNIILIVGDDVGYEIPTYNGGRSYQTPNLDFLAANGTQFPNFFAHPDGPPSRLALATGKYNFRNWVSFGNLPDNSKTIANMLQDANYATCFVGKWQFDGGDASIKHHGFNKYLVFMPFEPKQNNNHNQFYHRYKNPYLYANARYLGDDEVKNKYSEDMFFEYASHFIDSNKSKPFFLLYSHTLVQRPFSPTPDDADYAAWNPDVDDIKRANKTYFPSMVRYMDKTIGKLIKKVASAGLASNTLIIFTGDNGTTKNIVSNYKGTLVHGGKGSTTNQNLKVPLVAYCPGLVIPHKTDTSLADMTDFLPTFADVAKIPKPTTWGLLDGTTFYDNLTGITGKQRRWVYGYWPGYFDHPDSKVYAFNYNYKLYDSTSGNKFYNIIKDPAETTPLKFYQLTDADKLEKRKLKNVLNTMQ